MPAIIPASERQKEDILGYVASLRKPGLHETKAKKEKKMAKESCLQDDPLLLPSRPQLGEVYLRQVLEAQSVWVNVKRVGTGAKARAEEWL